MLPSRQESVVQASQTNGSMSRETILAIEDDPAVLSLYVSFFEKKGFQVLTASDATEATRVVEEFPNVRLILLDLNLPGMSGEEWMNWYEKRAGSSASPIVVVSGKGDILSVTREKESTAALTKPFHMDELEELVDVLLEEDWQSEITEDTKTH